MKNYVLSYYPIFKCVAQNCTHTCCAGWKMNIDRQSLSAYQKNKTSFSKTLKKGINFKKSNFKWDKDRRCYFLNKAGLCEIIINLGEESLCQVCRDHPRFRSFFNDRTETGLGFCCEEATQLILNYKDKVEPILISDDQQEYQLDFNQKNLLEFRQKALNIVQDRLLPINDRINCLLSLCKADFSDQLFNRLIKTFLGFERLDKSWATRLKKIKNKPVKKQVNEQNSIYCEQFLVNELFRHLSDAEDTMWVRARAIACVLAWCVVQSLISEETGGENDFELIKDVVRAYSAEVEYSQKNLNKLFRFAYKFIRI